jgi:hypothetical protein
MFGCLTPCMVSLKPPFSVRSVLTTMFNLMTLSTLCEHCLKIESVSQVWWGYSCNPSYSGGRDRRMVSSRLAQAKVAGPCLRSKTHIHTGWGDSSSGKCSLSMCEVRSWVQSSVLTRKKTEGEDSALIFLRIT